MAAMPLEPSGQDALSFAVPAFQRASSTFGGVPGAAAGLDFDEIFWGP